MLLSRFPYRLIPTLPPKKLMGGMFRNSKHFPCLYQVLDTGVEVWENKFPQLFQNVCGCLILELHRNQRKCYSFVLETVQKGIQKELFISISRFKYDL